MIYRKLKRTWSNGYANYIPNFKKVFSELSKIDSGENLFKRKPRLTDFYDELDPRGCSGREYADYLEALDEWEQSLEENKKL